MSERNQLKCVACFEGKVDRAQQCFKNEWTLKACENNQRFLN